MLPAAFCWTKIGAEAGEDVSCILARKELERQACHGFFAWGIGSALGDGLDALVKLVPKPQVVFSHMRAKAKAIDQAPQSVLLWTSYVAPKGDLIFLPPGCIVTSRGSIGQKTKHYALLCRSDQAIGTALPGSLRFSDLRNLGSGKSLGYSQVTAVVSHAARVALPAAAGTEYRIAHVAELSSPFFATLARPVELTVSQRRELLALGSPWKTLSDWISWTSDIRGAPPVAASISCPKQRAHAASA
jgi:hypothetical protein